MTSSQEHAMTLNRTSRRLGWAALAFFALKGVAWLILAAVGAAGLAAT